MYTIYTHVYHILCSLSKHNYSGRGGGGSGDYSINRHQPPRQCDVRSNYINDFYFVCFSVNQFLYGNWSKRTESNQKQRAINNMLAVCWERYEENLLCKLAKNDIIDSMHLPLNLNHLKRPYAQHMHILWIKWFCFHYFSHCPANGKTNVKDFQGKLTPLLRFITRSVTLFNRKYFSFAHKIIHLGVFFFSKKNCLNRVNANAFCRQ